MVHFVYRVLFLESSVGEIWINMNKLDKLYKSALTLYFYFFFYFIIFNDTLVSSTHALPANIFNLEGGDTMLARDNENFRARARIELATLQILDRTL